ncbi:hypothetical protein A4X13_0g1055 [Tilletia indica]|uniref:Uncharacterized protein n=1 Tax=Tilletia indica TaxID=43049 RepID=A0A177TFR2_9BASI|nr:hypothetical protein A4X13_0g1055 [Tilletia indica]
MSSQSTSSSQTQKSRDKRMSRYTGNQPTPGLRSTNDTDRSSFVDNTRRTRHDLLPVADRITSDSDGRSDQDYYAQDKGAGSSSRTVASSATYHRAPESSSQLIIPTSGQSPTKRSSASYHWAPESSSQLIIPTSGQSPTKRNMTSERSQNPTVHSSSTAKRRSSTYDEEIYGIPDPKHKAYSLQLQPKGKDRRYDSSPEQSHSEEGLLDEEIDDEDHFRHSPKANYSQRTYMTEPSDNDDSDNEATKARIAEGRQMYKFIKENFSSSGSVSDRLPDPKSLTKRQKEHCFFDQHWVMKVFQATKMNLSARMFIRDHRGHVLSKMEMAAITNSAKQLVIAHLESQSFPARIRPTPERTHENYIIFHPVQVQTALNELGTNFPILELANGPWKKEVVLHAAIRARTAQSKRKRLLLYTPDEEDRPNGAPARTTQAITQPTRANSEPPTDDEEQNPNTRTRSLPSSNNNDLRLPNRYYTATPLSQRRPANAQQSTNDQTRMINAASNMAQLDEQTSDPMPTPTTGAGTATNQHAESRGAASAVDPVQEPITAVSPAALELTDARGAAAVINPADEPATPSANSITRPPFTAPPESVNPPSSSATNQTTPPNSSTQKRARGAEGGPQQSSETPLTNAAIAQLTKPVLIRILEARNIPVNKRALRLGLQQTLLTSVSTNPLTGTEVSAARESNSSPAPKRVRLNNDTETQTRSALDAPSI